MVVKPMIKMYIAKVKSATTKYICAERLYLYELFSGV